MHIIKSIFISIFFVPFLVFILSPVEGFAQNQIVLPNAGFTPESPFYFLDKIGEALRDFLTFNPEAKVRLQVAYAAERVAEIKIILETKGVNAKGLEVAKARLEANAAKAADIVKKEKEKGKDVSKLAGEIVDNFHIQRKAAKQAFDDAKQEFFTKKRELHNQLLAAIEAGDTALQEQLRAQLVQIEEAKDEAEAKKDATIAVLETEKDRLQDELEEKKRQEDEARDAAERAEEEQKKAEEKQQELEEKMREEEAKKQEKLREAEEREKEQIEKEAERAQEQLKKEQEHAEEAQKRAEEKQREAEEKLKELEEKELKNFENGKKQNEESNSIRAPQIITVFIRSGRFDDNAVDVKRGDTIRWTNRDSQPHWPASNPHPVHTNLSGFDALRPIAPGESYEFTFDKQGAFGYHDHLNPAVTGIAIVK